MNETPVEDAAFEVAPAQPSQAEAAQKKPNKFVAFFKNLFKKNPNKIRESKLDVALGIINLVLLLGGVLIIVFPLLNYFALAFNDGNFNLNVVVVPVRFSFKAVSYVLFEDGAKQFWTSFGNSVIITVVVTIGSNLMMALAAYPLSKKDFPFRGGILIFFVITMLFSCGIMPIYLLMDAFGLIDNIFSIILKIGRAHV